jgi:uncharacterized lipoprotein
MGLLIKRIHVVVCLSTIVLLSLTGCALSPQAIHIKPVMTEAGSTYGQGKRTRVIITDQRPQTILGSRGGTYDNSSYINIANDFVAALRLSTEKRLAELGFNGADVNNAEVIVEVVVKQLNYKANMENYLHNIDLYSRLMVITHMGDSVHRGTYATNRSYQYLSAPDQDKNTGIINAILAETMSRGLSDPSLMRFITETH